MEAWKTMQKSTSIYLGLSLPAVRRMLGPACWRTAKLLACTFLRVLHIVCTGGMVKHRTAAVHLHTTINSDTSLIRQQDVVSAVGKALETPNGASL